MRGIWWRMMPALVVVAGIVICAMVRFYHQRERAIIYLGLHAFTINGYMLPVPYATYRHA